MRDILRELKDRDCIHDASHEEELAKLLATESVTFYCGFDPTADSLHAGSMLPLILMSRLQRAGHRPIVLLGSATGMIGDPSGKSEERKLLDRETIAANVAGIEQQVRLFLSFEGDNACRILRNDQWLGELNYLDFLRDIGKLFSVNAMIAKESVKARLESREQGISYTEFSYMLLQAYDFYWLNKQHDCRLQVGGSDQWGNITAGLELIRRRSPADHPPVYGLTFPLLTTAAGTKFGKTEKGAVWLSPDRTSSYEFYQYWFNTADADVLRYLQLFTDADAETIAEFKRSVVESPDRRAAQKFLAAELTALVHGRDAVAAAEAASGVLFGGSVENVPVKTLLEIFHDVPSVDLPRQTLAEAVSLQALLVQAGFAKTNSAARRLIEGGGIYLNNARATDAAAKVGLDAFIDGCVLVLRSGKKNYCLIKAVD